MSGELADALLGHTLLAWANCIGDFVSDPALARAGDTDMAVSSVAPRRGLRRGWRRVSLLNFEGSCFGLL